MKKVIVVIAMMIAALGMNAQTKAFTFHSSLICHKLNTDANWGPYGATNATFDLYKTNGKAVRIDANFSEQNNYTIPTQFVVYAESYGPEDNGNAYYLYVYYAGDEGTSKTYDKTEYFKIKDQVKERQSSVQLIGYKDSTDWAWIIDSTYTY